MNIGRNEALSVIDADGFNLFVIDIIRADALDVILN